MPVAKMKLNLPCSVQKVWELVTSLTDYAWRSDLLKIEVTEPGKRFSEYTKDGHVTQFTITEFEPYKRYAFDLENEAMYGHWTGVFSELQGKAAVEFTEEVTAKKLILKPFIKGYLQNQQAVYAEDLKRAADIRLPMLKCSICNGEQVAGFKNPETGVFEEVMFIRSDADLHSFMEQYHLKETPKKFY